MYNLLFVDDDQWIAESMRTLLTWENYLLNPPYIAYSMEQAQEIFRKIPIHILISDIEMVGQSGFDLLKWVHDCYPDTLSGFLTCHARFDFAQRAIKLGVFGYLLKPVNENELADLLQSCIQVLEPKKPPAETVASVLPSARIQKILDYINQNIGNPISRESICRELYISENYLSRTFTKEMGMTLVDYITECRINKAKELLRTTDLTVTNICTQVGYNYAAYFTKIFKEKTGMTPNQYREQHG